MEKTVTIIVEGTPHEWPEGAAITFDQVVIFAFPDYSPTDGKAYTVTYEGADGGKPEGQLVKGGTVKIKNGTIFHVSRTGES